MNSEKRLGWLISQSMTFPPKTCCPSNGVDGAMEVILTICAIPHTVRLLAHTVPYAPLTTVLKVNLDVDQHLGDVVHQRAIDDRGTPQLAG